MVSRFLPVKKPPGEGREKTTMLAAAQGRTGSSQEDTDCPGSCDSGCLCLSQLLAGAWSVVGKPKGGCRTQEGHPRVLPAGTPLGTGHPRDTCQIAPSKQGWQQLGACRQPGGVGFTFLPCACPDLHCGKLWVSPGTRHGGHQPPGVHRRRQGGCLHTACSRHKLPGPCSASRKPSGPLRDAQ